MRYLLLLIIPAWAISCQPAKSDIYVETVNLELVLQLIKKAHDSSWISADSIKGTPPVWVSGLRLQFENPADETFIWYDEQKRVTGLVEIKNNVVKDSIQFFLNGQRMFSLLFNNAGKPSGPARYYYEDGRVREDGRFENGIKTGVWRQFRPDGTLEMANEFDRYGNPKR